MLSGRRHLWIFGLVLIASAALVAGCGKKDSGEKVAEGMLEEALEQSGGEADVDIEGSDLTMESGDVSLKSTATAEWPGDLPASVPRFAYGVPVRVTRTEQGTEGTTYGIALKEIQTGALDKYSADLKAAGWEVLTTMTSGEGGTIMAKKDALALTFAYNEEEDFGNLAVMPNAD